MSDERTADKEGHTMTDTTSLPDGEPCSVCGNEDRRSGMWLTCECPAPLDPDRLREDRDERRRMEKEYPYAE